MGDFRKVSISIPKATPWAAVGQALATAGVELAVKDRNKFTEVFLGVILRSLTF